MAYSGPAPPAAVRGHSSTRCGAFSSIRMLRCDKKSHVVRHSLSQYSMKEWDMRFIAESVYP